jgi:hypothetical protein
MEVIMSVIRTGLVYQRTAKGPNYVCLGKAVINGETMVVSTKNGNITASGKCKAQGSGFPVTLHAHYPDKVARIHDVRSIDVKSVFTRGGAEADLEVLTKKMLKKGLECSDAELPHVSDLK